MSPKIVKFKINRQVVDVGSPPKQAHKFLFTRIGREFVLEVGFFDFTALRAAIEAGSKAVTPRPVSLHISDRFVLSFEAARELVELGKQVEAAIALGDGASAEEKA